MRFFPMLPWCVDILVAFVMSMPCSFVLEVLFVIVCQHVLVSCRLRSGVLAGEVSQELVDQMALLILVDVHVSYGRFLLLGFLSSRGSSPVSLDTLHVPLIDHCYDCFSFASVEFPENVLVSEIDENSLLLRSELG